MTVIGTHGKSRSGFWPLGNFPETLAESLEVPVMVVHSSRALVKWKDGASKLRMCAGLDLSNDVLPVLTMLRGFQEAGDCEFTVCHVKRSLPPVDGMPVRAAATAEFMRSVKHEEMTLRRLVRRHVGVSGHSDVEFAAPNTEAHLIEHAHSGKAGVLVVGTHHRYRLGRLFLGSVSRAVLRRSPINVLVVPVTWKAQPAIESRKPTKRTTHPAVQRAG
jgi:nucleotide-binding universal stress UspA family protein